MAETRLLSEEAPNANSSQSTIAGGHLALVPTWLPLDIGPEQNSAGSGGDGTSIGTIGSNTLAMFMPSNAAIAGPHSDVNAQQGNNALINQHVTEMAGIGGEGGNGNLAGGSGSGSSAGSGGDGSLFGALVSTDTAVFVPVNMAVATGSGTSATAGQANNAAFLQGATQIGGVGGSGGDQNIAGGTAPAQQGATFVFNGDNYAGHGGNGTFIGSMVDVNVAVFSPINIAVGAAGGDAHATQTNNVVFDQGGVQIAGIGGNGGGFNLSSDTIFTGNGVAGGGGDGYSNGSTVGVNIGYFHPINIAVPAGGTADADQLNNVLLDQHTLQLGGVGGAGGEGNIADTHSALIDDVLQG
ncbi:hypothetical protein [Ensifer sp. MJa1]|uniref:hypothetical protein n=1 Tax=Ensifer sp. MJa1 TaxID=2919888 RepID=UPI003009C51B